MNELATREQTLDSREVAKMVDKNHFDLLRDIKTYVSYLAESNFAFSDFFQESHYKDKSGKTNPCYEITRKGCEFIANKLTGQKGTIFTAAYINKFHEMEKGGTTPTDKSKRLEIQEKNARIRASQTFLRISENPAFPKEYKSIFLSYASKELSGQELLPLPKVEEKTYTAAELGAECGVSANMIGRLANANNLKTPEYGYEVWDKSPYSVKQVAAWRYNEKARQKLKELINMKAAN